MAKTTAPLLSFGGSGQIAKTQVYSKWRGVSYARRYVIPANPQTTKQTQNRNTFNWLNQAWKNLDAGVQSVWTAFAKGRPFTDRNAFISQNLAAASGSAGSPATSLSGCVMSPGANAGIAAGGITTADDSAHGLNVTLTAPTLPSSWTITAAHVVVFAETEASTSTVYTSHYGDDTSSPYEVSFADIGAATYDCFGFFEYVKPDGSTAYSPSLYASQVIA